MNRNSIYNSIPQNKYIQTCVAILFLTFIFGVYATFASAENKPSVHTIYHVYINNEHIGSLLDDQPVYSYIDELLETSEELFPGLTLQVSEKVKIIPEFIFTEGRDDEHVLPTLKEKLTIEAESMALMINEEPAVYLGSEEDVKEVMDLLITQYMDEQKYEQYLEGIDESTLEVGETLVIDITLTEDITEDSILVDPDQILSVKDAIKKLNKGVLEEKPYQVKEGDVLGSIASAHDLTTAKLLELNEDLSADSVIRIGQKLQVTAYQPLVEVLSTHLSKVEEEIAFETEIKEDDSMWKGDNKVTQEGQTGSQITTYETTQKNGKTVKREVISEEVTNEPVKKVITKGTKEMPSRGSGQLSWPAVGGYISSYQGSRWGRFHKGIDIARPSNYNILAADNGKVTSASYQGGYGNLVRINHNNGMETVYAHLASIDVKVGQTVTKGQKIGVMGDTGNSTGIHLHFEVYQNGQLKNPKDFLN
ncbi:peptidoglycan DD-metalloendopeptidase family protein [Alkalihalobacillus deserti]|uniref:peptidoglycan DD-metalloendopeptidase family protein n=1 Tax=Alkalihalobacillus deserti TaxID=2879466 RepID=UPI001D14930D|nr:peptidoglycan DD-metalloendopeptidase family protein [Alkalihalobacillus deserti]